MQLYQDDLEHHKWLSFRIMLSDKEIKEIIRKEIEAGNKLGELHGGSGHLGFASYEIKDFNSKILDTGNTEIDYSYIIYVETEFTYYPDNPPKEYHYEDKIIVDKDKNLL